MGIWSLVVLNRREVREAFALNPRPAGSRRLLRGPWRWPQYSP